ncbi:MAG: hypothetical protein HYW62_02245 [Candidatus Levybacteria bacterium]|nr:hypothetical protein [Candidatus Levybacteria bacterium]
MSEVFKKIVAVGILIHIILLANFLLFLQYFQQDEWHGFGIILSYGTKYITVDKTLVELLLGDRIGARIITFGLFNLFELNTLPYGAFGFTFHVANAFLIFLLTKKLTKNLLISTLASFLFLINELGHEAYSWFGTMTGSSTSVFFLLLSLIFFLKFIDNGKVKLVLLSTFLLWVSFLFKEIGAFAFVFYPVLFSIYSLKRTGIKILLKKHLTLIILGLIMLSFFIKTVLFIPGDRANYVNTGSSLIPNIAMHSIQYPLEGIVQLIIPNFYLFKLSDITTRIVNPNLPSDSLGFLIASQNSNAEITILLLLVAFAILIFWLMRKLKFSSNSLKALKASIILAALSFLPYVVINSSFSYLDSRYYYAGSIGVAIFLAVLIFNLLSSNKRVFKIIAVFVLFLYVFIHESTLFSDLKLMADRSKERQNFLKQVENLVPVLPKKTVFFITGNSEGYYGLPELKTPFQSGLGHVLMVKYTTKRELNPDFFKEATFAKALDVGFLYDTLGQGYRQKDGKGFGYYYDKLELNKAIGQNLFDKDDVIYLYYNSETKKLERKDFK